jgi:NAD+ synthetase
MDIRAGVIMKIALGQINTTPNDFSGNTEQILDFVLQAGKKEADLLVFPELSIPGYLCKDLLYRKGFIEKNLESLAKVCDLSRRFPNLTIVVGYVGQNMAGSGKKFTNMAAVIRNGIVMCHYQKQLLPFYDVFDEGRYFEPGTQNAFVQIAGQRCAITICEDIWNDKGQDDYNYATNPLSTIDGKQVDLIINISSSPYGFGKPQQRFKMLEKISKDRDVSLVYVNQIGGQDELVFDGRSCIFYKKGNLIYETGSTKFSNATCPVIEFKGPRVDAIFDAKGSVKNPEPLALIQTIKEWHGGVGELYNSVLLGLRDYINKTGFKQVVLGSSGGIDSAVVAALACDAVGPDNVHCLMMPSIFSSEGSVADAEQLHKNLGCNQYTVPIEHQHLVKSINSYFPQRDVSYYSVADENIQARLRGLTVMHISNAFGYLPLTTGNKTELALGYCTLYGDMDGGFNPIGDLYKDQVYALAKHINTGEIILDKTEGEIIPSTIIDKAPSAELSKGQTDEKGLGADYAFLNAVVKKFVEEHISDPICFANSVDVEGGNPFATPAETDTLFHIVNKMIAGDSHWHEIYRKLIRRIDLMEFKRRQAAPTIKLSKVAFGTGRRLPVVQKVL